MARIANCVVAHGKVALATASNGGRVRCSQVSATRRMAI